MTRTSISPFSRPRFKILASSTADSISGNNVRMSQRMVFIQQTGHPSHDHGMPVHVYRAHKLPRGRNQMFCAVGVLHDKDRIAVRSKNFLQHSQGPAILASDV